MNPQKTFKKDIFITETSSWFHSPTEHNYEVHDIPAIPQVGAFMENKTESHQLDPRLEAEDPNKVRLCLLLLK